MSRTIRRKGSVKSYCGTLEMMQRAWEGSYARKRRGGNTSEETYKRVVAWYTRDHHSGIFSPPSWFMNLRFNRPHRMDERNKIHRHLRRGDWEIHLPESRTRDRHMWS